MIAVLSLLALAIILLAPGRWFRRRVGRTR